jgi:hypothetical protein
VTAVNLRPEERDEQPRSADVTERVTNASALAFDYGHHHPEAHRREHDGCEPPKPPVIDQNLVHHPRLLNPGSQRSLEEQKHRRALILSTV